MVDLYNVYTSTTQEVPVAENLNLKQAEALNETLIFLDHLNNLNTSELNLRSNPLDEDILGQLEELIKTSNSSIDIYEIVLQNRNSFAKGVTKKSSFKGRDFGDFNKQVSSLVESLFLEYQGELYQVLTESTLKYIKKKFKLNLDFKLCYTTIASRAIIDCPSLAKMTIESFQKFKGFEDLENAEQEHLIALLTFVNSFVDIGDHSIKIEEDPNYLNMTFSELGIFEVLALFKTKDIKVLCETVNKLNFDKMCSLHVPKYALLCLYIISNLIPRKFADFVKFGEKRKVNRTFGIFANEAGTSYNSWVNSLRLPNEEGEFVDKVDIDYLISRAQGTEIPTQFAIALLPLFKADKKRDWGIDLFEKVSIETFLSRREDNQTFYEKTQKTFSIAQFIEQYEIEGFSSISKIDETRKNDVIYKFYISTVIFRACAIAVTKDKIKRLSLTEAQITGRVSDIVKEYNKPLNKTFKNEKKGGNKVTVENDSRSALYNWFNTNAPLPFSFDPEEIVEEYVCVDFGDSNDTHYYEWCMEFLQAYAESQKASPGSGDMLKYLRGSHQTQDGRKKGIDIAISLIEALRNDGLKTEPYKDFLHLKGKVDIEKLNKVNYEKLDSSSGSPWTNEFLGYCVDLVPESQNFLDVLLDESKGNRSGLHANGFFHCFQAALLVDNTSSSTFKKQFHYDVIDLADFTQELAGVYVAISKSFNPLELAAGATKLTGCCQQLNNYGTVAALCSFYGDPLYMTYYAFEPNAELRDSKNTKFLCTTNSFVNRYIYPTSTFSGIKEENSLELVEGDTRLLNKLTDNGDFLDFIKGKDQVTIQNFDGFEPVRFINPTKRVLDRAQKALRIVSSLIEEQALKIGTGISNTINQNAGILAQNDFKTLTGFDVSLNSYQKGNPTQYKDGDPEALIPDFFGITQIFLASAIFKEMIVEVGSFSGAHPKKVNVRYIKNNGDQVSYANSIEWDYLRYMFAWPTGDEFIPFMGKVSFECPKSIQSKVEGIAQNLMYPEWFYGKPLERDGVVYDTKRFLELRTPKDGLFVNDVGVSSNPPRSNPHKRRSRRRR